MANSINSFVVSNFTVLLSAGLHPKPISLKKRFSKDWIVKGRINWIWIQAKQTQVRGKKEQISIWKYFWLAILPFLRVFKYCLTQRRKNYNNRCHSAHTQQAEAQQESAQRTVVYFPDTWKQRHVSVPSSFPHFFNIWGFTQFSRKSLPVLFYIRKYYN